MPFISATATVPQIARYAAMTEVDDLRAQGPEV